MLGMIKKDLCMVKNNKYLFVMAFVICIIYSFMFDMDMSFFLPFIGVISMVSTFSYDDYNNWHAYAATLPQGKINVVKSKYVVTIILTVVLTLAGLLLGFAIGMIKGNYNFDEAISSVMGETLAILSIAAILFPVTFKFGSEKGRLVLIVIGLGLGIIGLLFSQVIEFKPPVELILFITKYHVLLFITTIVLILTISYVISKKAYLKREF